MSVPARHPKNAPGPFYVVRDSCITCGTPEAEAPTLIATCSNEGGCYFKRQPETPDDVAAAIRAMVVSCIEVHRYGGNDPGVRTRLAELGKAYLCDQPLEGHPVVTRNFVRFGYPAARDALAMAATIAGWFERFWPADSETRGATGDDTRASFEFIPSRRYAPKARLFTVSPTSTGDWLVQAPEEIGYSMRLDELLRRNGASNVRWFSDDEWLADAPGKDRPY